METLFGKMRSLDAYPKINEDFYSRTLSGGVITLVSSIFMLLLFISELRLYFHTATETNLVVDTSRGERLRINFDVTFPALPCSILSLDAMDISGEQHLDVRHDIIKRRIDVHGNIIETRADTIGAPKIERPLQRHGGRLDHNETYCGSCYGAEVADEECCNNCEEVREAYRKKGWALSNPDSIDQCKREGFLQRIKEEEGEGCNLYGFLDVNKVAGNFHFAPGKSFQQSNVHVHDLLAFQKDSFNISHKINRLAFGDYFPGVVNPLDGVQWTQQTPNAMYQYFLKVGSLCIFLQYGRIKIIFRQPLFFVMSFGTVFGWKKRVVTAYNWAATEKCYMIDRAVGTRNYFLSTVLTYNIEILCSSTFWMRTLGHLLLKQKVVPTVFTDENGHAIHSNQFSVTEHVKGAELGRLQALPGVFFFYDLSPIKVTFTETHVSFLHFLTSVCAIVGGVFTVSGIIDSFVYHSQKAIKRKMEIGKFS